MDNTTELLLNITRQLGGLSADMATVKDSLSTFKEEMAQLKRDVKEHEGIHVELAPKRDLDELWTQIRKHDNRITELMNADAQKALKRDTKIKDQLITIVVSIIGTGLILSLVYGVVEELAKK